MWDETIKDRLDADTETTLKLGFEYRQKAKALEIEAKEMKTTADILLGGILDDLQVDKIKGDLGQISRRKGKVSYKLDMVKEYLLGHGVSAKVINNAVNAAKSEGKGYIEYRAPKK